MSVNGMPDDALVLRVHGDEMLSMAAVRAVETVCAAVDRLAGSAVVSVLISGAPAGSWTRDADVALVTKWERVLRRLERLGATTVAVATGDVGGLALDALLATDYRIAAPDLRLLVTVDGGATWPGMATYRLTREAGVASVRRAVLFGHSIGASQALALGLVHEVADDPSARHALVATELAGLASRELAIRRQLMLNAGTTTFEDALGAHLAACDRALRRATAGAAP